jgi:hypothetical protein
MARYEATKKWAEKVATESIQARIAALKLPEEYLKTHINPLLEKHELCFSKDGEIVPGELDRLLDAIEGAPAKKPANPFFMSRQVDAPGGNGRMEEPPAEPASAPQSEAEVDELISRVPAYSARMS